MSDSDSGQGSSSSAARGQLRVATSKGAGGKSKQLLQELGHGTSNDEIIANLRKEARVDELQQRQLRETASFRGKMPSSNAGLAESGRELIRKGLQGTSATVSCVKSPSASGSSKRLGTIRSPKRRTSSRTSPSSDNGMLWGSAELPGGSAANSVGGDGLDGRPSSSHSKGRGGAHSMRATSPSGLDGIGHAQQRRLLQLKMQQQHELLDVRPMLQGKGADGIWGGGGAQGGMGGKAVSPSFRTEAHRGRGRGGMGRQELGGANNRERINNGSTKFPTADGTHYAMAPLTESAAESKADGRMQADDKAPSVMSLSPIHTTARAGFDKQSTLNRISTSAGDSGATQATLSDHDSPISASEDVSPIRRKSQMPLEPVIEEKRSKRDKKEKRAKKDKKADKRDKKRDKKEKRDKKKDKSDKKRRSSRKGTDAGDDNDPLDEQSMRDLEKKKAEQLEEFLRRQREAENAKKKKTKQGATTTESAQSNSENTGDLPVAQGQVAGEFV